MSARWEALVAWWGAVDLEAALAWPWWPAVAVALAGLLGLALGRWSARRRQPPALGSAEILSALERVARGDHQGALHLLQDATQRPDSPPELYLALAALLRALGHGERSAQLHRALLERPGLPALLQTRASLGLASDFLTLDRAAEAEALLLALPRKVRKQEALLALRRSAALRSGDWKEALAAGSLLARGDAYGAEVVSEVHARMAEAARARGDLDEAAACFRRALSRDEGNTHAREGLARIYLQQKKNFRAKRLLEVAIAQTPDAAPRLLPLLRRALGSPTKARRALERLREQGVASPWVELELAEMDYAHDDLDQARRALEALVARYPRALDVREAYLNLLIASADERTLLAEVDRFMALASEQIARFECRACGLRQTTSFSLCPRCGAYGTVGYKC
jgi:lipopolysaccharide biosynthesis regulator YciM